MVGKSWLRVLFSLWENYYYIINTKDRAVEHILGYGYQCQNCCDGERATTELIDKLVERQAVVTVVNDLKRIYIALPNRLKKVLKLRFKDKALFWQVAKNLDCSIRNAIYIYNKAEGQVSKALAGRGYSDRALFELFEGDKMVEYLYATVGKEELETSDDGALADGIAAQLRLVPGL